MELQILKAHQVLRLVVYTTFFAFYCTLFKPSYFIDFI